MITTPMPAIQVATATAQNRARLLIRAATSGAKARAGADGVFQIDTAARATALVGSGG